ADWLDLLPAEVALVLRAAALLGDDFAVTDLAAVLQRPASELKRPLAEAVAAGVIGRGGPRLAVRHPLSRPALSGGVPSGRRACLHRHTAQALAAAGVSEERVAAHVLRASADTDGWVVSWLAGHAATLARRAPRTAVELLARTIAGMCPEDPRWDELNAVLAWTLFRLGDNAKPPARRSLAGTTDPERAAQMRGSLGALLLSEGRVEDARDAIGEESPRPGVPVAWRARLRALATAVDAHRTGRAADTENAAQQAEQAENAARQA